MNNTLTGLGLALVLALIAALIGPWFINWSAYRDGFAAQASAIVGAPVKLSGAVDARLLPSPYVRFRALSAGAGASRLSVDEVEVTLAIAPLMRGAIKAERVRLIRPRFGVEVLGDGTARTAFSGGARERADRVSLDRVEIVDGVVDVASPGGRAFVERVAGVGGAGSLAGPYRFEGSGVHAGRRYDLRLSTARVEPSGAVRLKATVTQGERPETMEADGALTFAAKPRFEGRAVVQSPVLRGGRSEPWRLAASVKAGLDRLAFDDLDFAYGPDDRAIRLGGAGTTALAGSGRFDVALETRQLDLDRFAGEDRPRTPGALLAAVADRIALPGIAPREGRLSLDVRGVVLAGDVVQNLKAALTLRNGAWRVDAARADLPGASRAAASGDVSMAAAPEFAGSVEFGTSDLSGFRRWLSGGEDGLAAPVRRLALKGRVAAGSSSVAIDDAELETDGARSSGRIAWRAAASGARARVEAALTSEALDLDAVGGGKLLRQALDSGSTDVLVAIDAKSLTAFGVRMAQASIDGAIGVDGIDLKRLDVRDAGGARIQGAGRITQSPAGPEGKLGFDVSADRLRPLLAFIRAAGAPSFAVDALERRSGAITPVRLRVEIEADKNGERLAVRGDAAGGRLDGRIATRSRSISAGEPAEIDVRLDSADGRRLAALVGVEVSPVVEAKGGSLWLRLSGAPAKSMAGEGGLTALGVELSAKGTVAPAGTAGVSAEGEARLVANDLSTLGEAVGRLTPGSSPRLPASLSAKFAVGPDGARAEGISGEIGGRTLRGRADIAADGRKPVSGAFEFDELPLSAIVALAASPAAATAEPGRIWPSTPFGPAVSRGLSATIDLSAARMPLGAGLIAGDARTRLSIRPAGLALDDFSASFGEGRLRGSLAAVRSGDDATVSIAARLENASAEALFGKPADGAAVSGHADLALEAQGTGKSVSAVVAALTGAGTITARGVAIRRLDVDAIDRIEPLVESGLALDASKVAEALNRELNAGDLAFDRVTVPITIAGGAIRAGSVIAGNGRAKLGGSASLDLRRFALDAGLTLQPDRADAPQIGVSFAGPMPRPLRRVDATAFTGWLSVRAVDRETKRIEEMEKDIAERARVARLRAEEDRKRAEEQKRLAEEARRRDEEAKRLEDEARNRAEEERKALEDERRKGADMERRRREAEVRAQTDPAPRVAPQAGQGLPQSLDLSSPGLSTAPARPASPPAGIFGGPNDR